jgi:hypothetical protein
LRGWIASQELPGLFAQSAACRWIKAARIKAIALVKPHEFVKHRGRADVCPNARQPRQPRLGGTALQAPPRQSCFDLIQL